MPKLIIDNREITVLPGTKVIDAAQALGIMIPRFCFHPALGSVGACRVCAVKILEGTRTGIQMSCMIEADDGMVVSTTDADAVDFRKSVIEWLMVNHPHDCPVCDEGGHCLLQDMTVSGGHGIRRFAGKKRTHRDQDLGPLVRHEMNRCIQCYRCVRFYREFAGYPDLGVMGIGSRVYFGRHREGALESPFSGNLIDICPTGVYTDKPARFKGRRWDFQRSDSLCIHCCLGCRTVVSARYREVDRVEARFSTRVNGHFICDRGRYGFYYAAAADRPRWARVNGRKVSREKAIQAAGETLKQITDQSGAGTVAVAGSTRSNLETLATIRHLCREKGWTGPSVLSDRSTARKVKTAVLRLEPDMAVSLQQMASADFILAVGADPVNEAPMLAMAMRQAFRNGAKITVLDPRPVDLSMDFQHLPAAPETLASHLGVLLKNSVDRTAAKTLGQEAVTFYDALPDAETRQEDRITSVVEDLRRCRRPVIVCGTAVVPETVIGLTADILLLLRPIEEQAGLFFLMPGANGFGPALISDHQAAFDQILEGMESGAIRALILVETDPFRYCPDRKRLKRALERLDLLVVFDYVQSPAAASADIFIPTATIHESGGLFVNAEGRVQRALPAFKGGIPVAQIHAGNHPPRTFRKDIPGGQTGPAWETVSMLAGDPPEPEKDRGRKNLKAWLTEAHPVFAKLPPMDDFPEDGIRLAPEPDVRTRFRPVEIVGPDMPADTLDLLTVDWTFGTEELSGYSPCLQQREDDPCLLVQNDDAAAIGLVHGDTAKIETDTGRIQVPVKVVEQMAAGVVVLPRHRRIDWQCLGKGPELMAPG